MLYYFIQLNLKLLFILVLYGFAIGKLRRASWKNFSKHSNSFLVLDFFNLIGTPVHELSHLFFAILFGYHIDRVCLYRRIKTALANRGVLGYVKIHHPEKTVFQKLQKRLGLFFIGAGPLLLPPVLLLGLGSLLPDSITVLPSSFHQGLHSLLKSLQLLDGTDIIIMFAYLYVIIGVSMNMELSRQDLHMAFQGLLLLELLFLGVSALFVLTGRNLNIFIDILFRWNLMIALIGTFCSLSAHLISLLTS